MKNKLKMASNRNGIHVALALQNQLIAAVLLKKTKETVCLGSTVVEGS